MRKILITTICLLLSMSSWASEELQINSVAYEQGSRILLLHTSEGIVSLKLGGQTCIYGGSAFSVNTVDTFNTSKGVHFPEEYFIYPRCAWLNNVTGASLLNAGLKSVIDYYEVVSTNPLILKGGNEYADIALEFEIKGSMLRVNQTIVPRRDGYYSLSTRDILNADKQKPFKIVIPGYVHAERINSDFISSYAYEHGAPDMPVVYQDKCATTPVSIIQTNDITIGVAPSSEYPRKPYMAGNNTHNEWNVGYAFMNGYTELTPLLYYPVIGTPKSYLKKGEPLKFAYNIIVSRKGWYDVYKKAVYDVFHFDEMRNLRNKKSLSDRMARILKYMEEEGPRLFIKSEYDNVTISAQEYLGGIKGADGDGMKNADYGAMWMLAELTDNSVLKRDILPYVRNFKLKQMFDSGKYKGAPRGQYFLWKGKKWVEEWGEHIEPIAITYYSLIDVANMLLFQPNDKALKKSIRASADLLLNMQRADGSWPLGVDIRTGESILQDLQDFRPTFYGMYVAYKVLGKKKYLNAAVRGADWFLRNAVNENQFVGVCGDTRFAPDFATGMAVEALLDMYAATNNEKYKEAALKVAEYYTTYIYTHPSESVKLVHENGRQYNQQAYTQSGLVCEHIGVIGSANPQGPILLSSFAGMFVRLYRTTGDELFLDMARASANGRDNFVEERSGIASYYWSHFNKTALPYPQHAWWQIGWIMDYLMSEAELRSNGRISFPRGYITPKVGPHKITGFEAGVIDGMKANLVLEPEMTDNANPDLEVLTAISEDKETRFFIIMNSSNAASEMNMKLGKESRQVKDTIEPYGIRIIKMQND